ncbi:DUF7715 family protein [Ornithinimicrobium panacihumi]|uniref:DUF7715 family protein n=1 Tax=Ornithinimicrobium panacihumi TaxID=2008449 RepID=UPI003F8A2B53
MRILVATSETNGQVEGDYDFCIEGELVYMQEPCGRDRRDPDGGCGCGRGFAGMSSHRGTTTAVSIESPLTEDEVREALRSSLVVGGWLDAATHPPGSTDPLLEQLLAYMRGVAREIPAGTVVRRRLNEFYYLVDGGGPEEATA